MVAATKWIHIMVELPFRFHSHRIDVVSHPERGNGKHLAYTMYGSFKRLICIKCRLIYHTCILWNLQYDIISMPLLLVNHDISPTWISLTLTRRINRFFWGDIMLHRHKSPKYITYVHDIYYIYAHPHPRCFSCQIASYIFDIYMFFYASQAR